MLAKKSKGDAAYTIDHFIEFLEELKIRCSRNTVLKNTSKFQYNEGKTTYINGIKILMFLCQFQEENQE